MDHRAPEAMALLKERHEGESTQDIKRIAATCGEHFDPVCNLIH